MEANPSAILRRGPPSNHCHRGGGRAPASDDTRSCTRACPTRWRAVSFRKPRRMGNKGQPSGSVFARAPLRSGAVGDVPGCHRPEVVTCHDKGHATWDTRSGTRDLDRSPLGRRTACASHHKEPRPHLMDALKSVLLLVHDAVHTDAAQSPAPQASGEQSAIFRVRAAEVAVARPGCAPLTRPRPDSHPICKRDA